MSEVEIPSDNVASPVRVVKPRGRPPGFKVQPKAIQSDAQAGAAERPAMRAQMREEDPLERARKRAAEIIDHFDGSFDGADEFAAPQAPPGWKYEWRTWTVLNKEDPTYQVSLARMGWTPVPVSRHPEMMPAGTDGAILRKGNMLMERPLEIIEMARRREAKAAKDQIRAKEAQLGAAPSPDQFGRDHAQVRPNVRKGYEPIPIPADS